MRKEDLNQTDDIFIEKKLEEAFGYSDEQLLDEFDRAAAQAAEHPNPRLTPPKDEFQKIMARVEDEKKADRKVLRLKKVMKPLLVAAALGTVVLGTGIGVSGKRDFEYWVREKNGGEEVVFNNAESVNSESELEKVYNTIEEQLGIRSIDLFYMPSEMDYNDFKIIDSMARIEFEYKNNYIHFYQTLLNEENSTDFVSDRQLYQSVYNRYLDKTIFIYKNELEDGENEFGAQFTDEKTYYFIIGIMDEDEFIKIIENMHFYKK